MSENRSKKWYTSKVLWTNAIAIALMLFGSTLGIPVEEHPETAVTLLGFVNIVLRIVTKTAIDFK